MKLLMKAALGLVLVVVLALVGMRFLVPADAIRDQIAAAIENETGRKLEIAGDASVRGFPGLGVSLKDVRLRDPEGMGDGNTLQMDALKVDVELVPLLSREVAIKRLILTRPRITLRTDAQGRKNWEMRRADKPDEPRIRFPSAVKRDQPEKSLPGLLGGLALSNARIEDGEIRIIDERARTERVVEHVNLAFALPSLGAPLDLKGDFALQDERVAFKGTLASIEAVLDGKTTPLTLALDARTFSARFDGRLTPGEKLLVDGDLSAKSPAVRDLIAWLGEPPKAANGFGPAELAGHLDVKPEGLTLSKLRGTMDGQQVEGHAVLVTGANKPLVRAKLRLDRLDLAQYLAPRQPERRTERLPFIRAQAADDPLGDRLDQDRSVPKQPVRQAQAPTDGRKRPGKIRLAAVDAELDLSFGEIITRRLHIGRTVVAAGLKDGLLDTSVKEMEFYGGQGSGKVSYDTRGEVPAIRAEATLTRASGLQLLKDAAEFDWLSGNADLSLLVTANGFTSDEIKSSLNGNGKLVMADGAIEGLDLPGMLRNLKQGQKPELRRSEGSKTPFSRLDGTFHIENGIARTDDLRVDGPLVRMTATGEIDVPAHSIDMEVEPKIVASLEETQTVENAAGIAVPFRIEGPLDHPSLRLDLQRMFSNPEQTRKTVREIGEVLRKKLKGRRAGEILDNLLGPPRDGETEESWPDDEAEPDAAAPEDERMLLEKDDQPEGRSSDARDSERRRPRDVLRDMLR